MAQGLGHFLGVREHPGLDSGHLAMRAARMKPASIGTPGMFIFELQKNEFDGRLFE